MHKYQPRIHLVKRNNNDHHHSSQSNNQIVDLENAEYKTFIFPESVFTAVTAYQNQLVSYFLQFLFIFISTQIPMKNTFKPKYLNKIYIFAFKGYIFFIQPDFRFFIIFYSHKPTLSVTVNQHLLFCRLNLKYPYLYIFRDSEKL